MTHVYSEPRAPAEPPATGRRPLAGRVRTGAVALAAGLCLAALAPAMSQAALKVPDRPRVDDKPGIPEGPAPRPAPRPPRPELAQTGFDAGQHGFQFVNSFSRDLGVTLPIIGRVNFGSFDYGLCGGMVYAAADSHLSGAATPRIDTEPPPGSVIRKYLFRRQVDSLTAKRADALRRFLRWQMLPLGDKKFLGKRIVKGLRNRSRDQYKDKIRPRLGRGAVVPLGVVKVHGLASPLRNHQVLATGFRDLGDDQGLIAVYDPNYPVSPRNPDGITYLNMSTRRQSFDPEGRRPTGDRFRAIFSTPYSRKSTPWRPRVRDHRS
jgi:hypothetical protein